MSRDNKKIRSNKKEKNTSTKSTVAVTTVTARTATTEMDQIEYSKLRELDAQKLASIGLSAYSYRFDPNVNKYSKEPYKYAIYNMKYFSTQFSYLTNGEMALDFNIALLGRIYTVRRASKKLIFLDIHDDGEKIQIMLNAKYYLNGDEHYNIVSNVVRPGDFIGVAGIPTRTSTGELSLIPHRIEILTMCKALLPPRTSRDETTGQTKSSLCDQEIRYRQRYLDFIINEDNLNIFKKRSMIIKSLRTYLDDCMMYEVETPILNPIVGGATAKPFVTHSNDYDCPLYMRVAPELYLKMLIVGGFTGVYELGKQFRNESNDHTHNSEFTSLEFYVQNFDYYELMDFSETMISHIVKKINGSYKVKYDGKELDFTPPFKRLDMLTTLEEEAKIKLPKDLTTDTTREFLDEICKKLNVECAHPRTVSRLLDKLVGTYVEPLCINPTFITGHPQIMSPLAKQDRYGSDKAERFELFVNSIELANAYTELNDPKIQMDTFKLQAKNKDMGDDESMPIDMNFIRALEHGLPPTGGFGLGVDRFVMFLTGCTNIRDVILFPTMKPLHV
jgi:lysyl-tRNA synthetase class 2